VPSECRPGVALREELQCFREEGASSLGGRSQEEPRPAERARAASEPGHLGAATANAIPALIGTLKDAGTHVRKLAIWALGDIGQHARAVLPALCEALLNDAPSGVRRRAAVALAEIGTQEARPTPAEAGSRERDEGVRKLIAAALANVRTVMAAAA
jgi:HEAT repeat protein